MSSILAMSELSQGDSGSVSYGAGGSTVLFYYVLYGAGAGVPRKICCFSCHENELRMRSSCLVRPLSLDANAGKGNGNDWH